MVKKIWNRNSNAENFIILFLTFIAIIISGASLNSNIAGILILPIPVALFYMKVDFKKFATFIGFMILINLIVNGLTGAIGAFFLTIIVGTTLGFGIEKKYKSINIIKLLSLVCLFSIVITFILLVIINKVNVNAVLESIVSFYKGEIGNLISRYKSLGIDESSLVTFTTARDNLDVNFIISLIPYILTIYSLLACTINYFVIRRLLQESEIELPEKIGFRSFYISNIFGAILIGITCIGVIISTQNIKFGGIVRDSAITIMYILMVINGMAAVTYLFRVKIKKSRLFVGILLFVLVNLDFRQVLLCIGFAEMLLDFRKMDPYNFRKNKKGV